MLIRFVAAALTADRLLPKQGLQKVNPESGLQATGRPARRHSVRKAPQWRWLICRRRRFAPASCPATTIQG